MKTRDKNKVILTVAAILIAISIAITLIAFIYEKSLVKDGENNDTPPKTTASDKQDKNDNKKPEETKAPDNTESETKAPDTTKAEAIVTGDNKPGTYKVTTKDSPLGIRTKPEQTANQSGNVAKGSEVKIVATYGDWAYYHEEASFGWLSMKYLELVSEGDAPKYSIGKYAVKTDNETVIIREEPENYTAVRGRAKKDTQVEVLTVAGDWGYVETQDGSGWLPFENLEKIG